MGRGDQPRFTIAWWRRLGWLAFLVVAAWLGWLGQSGPAPEERPVEGDYRVERVVDGDTLLLTNRSRVRLQGIDAPETVHPDKPVERLGPEASAFVRAFVEQAGGEVRLTFGDERVDRYGRWLAFIWRGERMLNEELVRAGLARARLDYRYAGRMKRRLKAAQDEARDAGRGLWSGPPPVKQSLSPAEPPR